MLPNSKDKILVLACQKADVYGIAPKKMFFKPLN